MPREGRASKGALFACKAATGRRTRRAAHDRDAPRPRGRPAGREGPRRAAVEQRRDFVRVDLREGRVSD